MGIRRKWRPAKRCWCTSYRWISGEGVEYASGLRNRDFGVGGRGPTAAAATARPDGERRGGAEGSAHGRSAAAQLRADRGDRAVPEPGGERESAVFGARCGIDLLHS